MTFVPLNPDTYVPSGFRTEFDGVLVDICSTIRTYPSGDAAGKYAPCAKLIVKPDDGSDNEVILLNCGDLRRIVPSLDGENPVKFTTEMFALLAEAKADPSEEELLACRGIGWIFVGKSSEDKRRMTDNSSWAFFMHELRQVTNPAYPKEVIESAATVEHLLGIHAHWSRKENTLLKQDKKDSKKDKENGKDGKDKKVGGDAGVWVITDIIAMPDPARAKALLAGMPVPGITNAGSVTGAVPGTVSTPSAPGVPPASASTDDERTIINALYDSLGNDPEPMTTARVKAISAIKAPALKGQALRLYQDVNWLSAQTSEWIYDPSNNTVLKMPK